MVLSSQAFAFHRVRGLVLENPQPQPQAESYVKLFIGADAMQGAAVNPAGAPRAGRICPREPRGSGRSAARSAPGTPAEVIQ